MLQQLKNLGFRWLKKSEKLTKTDMIYFTKGGFWLTINQFLSSAVAFGLAIAYANLLSPEVYGAYKYIISVAAIVSIPTLSGIDTAVARAAAQGNRGSLIPAFNVKLKWGWLACLASIAVAVYYLLVQYNLQLSLAFVLLALIVSSFESLRLYQSYLVGLKEFKFLSASMMVIKIVSAITVLIALLLHVDLVWLVVAYFVPQLLVRWYYWLKTIKKYPPNQSVDPQTIHLGKQLTVNNIVISISDQLDQVLLFNLLGPVQLAIFQFAVAPIEQVKGLLKNIPAIAMPKFASRSQAEIRKTIDHRLWRYAALLTVLVAIYIPLAPWLFKLVFPRYLAAASLSQVFAISLIAVPLLGIITTIFESQAMVKQLYKLRLFNAVSQIVITVGFIVYLGLWGAILARVVQRFVSLIASWWMLRQSEAAQ